MVNISSAKSCALDRTEEKGALPLVFFPQTPNPSRTMRKMSNSNGEILYKIPDHLSVIMNKASLKNCHNYM